MGFALAKLVLPALLALLGCAGGPDEVSVGYGRTFAGDARIGAFTLDYEDSDTLTVLGTWKLRPTVVRLAPGERSWLRAPARPEKVPEIGAQEPETAPEPVPAAPEPDPAEPEPAGPGVIEKGIEQAKTFDAFDWITKVGFFVLAGWLAWLYREPIRRRIRGRNGNA